MADKREGARTRSEGPIQMPDKIDELIRVSTPRTWILALALVSIIVGVLIWGFTGSIPKTYSAKGVVREDYSGNILCLLPIDVAGQYLEGHEAHVTLASGNGFSSTVIKVSEDPFSYEEVKAKARSDWRLEAIWGDSSDLYQYAVVIGLEDAVREEWQMYDRELVSVSVVLSDVKPISYVLN